MKRLLPPALLGVFVAGLAFAPTAQAAGQYSFSCSIGRYGADPCGAAFDVRVGEIVRVNLVSSGGKSVGFCATNASTGATYQCTAKNINPGAVTTTVWQNHTSSTRRVRMTADAASLVNVTANGNFLVVSN